MRNLLLASVFSLASIASAQCGTLAITGAGTVGTTLTVAVTGTSANGTTAINLGPLSLTLGLAQPFFPLPLGTADANGNASVSFLVPAGITRQVQLNAQAATFAFTLRPFAIAACASNVVGFTIG